MLNLRQIHRYLSVFFAPAILFFSFTGALQTFRLHESAQRGAPPPVAWIAAMASVHKDQHLPRARPRPADPAQATTATNVARPVRAPSAEAPDQERSTLPLKLFVLALAIGLCVTALVGLTIAFTNPRSRKQSAVMLVLGALLPALLLFI